MVLLKSKTKRGKIKEARAIMRASLFNELASYGYCKGDVFTFFPNDICHSGLLDREAPRGVEFVLSKVRLNNQHPEESRRYMNWVLRRSPMAPFFKTKTIAFGLENAILLDGDIPSNMMLFCITAYRQGYERDFTFGIKLWDWLVKEGVSPEMAVLLLSNVSKETDTLRLNALRVHHAISDLSGISLSEASLFLNGSIPNVDSFSFRKEPAKLPVHRSLGEMGRKGDNLYDTFFSSLFTDKTWCSTWGKEGYYSPSAKMDKSFVKRVKTLEEELCKYM